MGYLFYAFIATVGTWLITAVGAATVFFFKKINSGFMNAMLGFSGGIMISASFFSLISPALELSKNNALPPWCVCTLGFLAGGAFILLCDKVVNVLQKKSGTTNSRKKRVFLLIWSITLHNIPEGLAVGVAFGALRSLDVITAASLAAPISIALGIGLQNFPEGAAVSLPLRREGLSAFKSFFYGQISGIVEPIFGVIGALLVFQMSLLLPYALSFAAGAMMFVVVKELIPEGSSDDSNTCVFGFMLGFAIMMLLDVALG